MRDKVKGTFKVRISREDLSFSAGHISIYQGSIEAFHGHSYRVAIEFEGSLNEDFILIDFRTIKDTLKPICKSLNHRILVPLLHPKLEISQDEQFTRIVFNNEYMKLPSSDVMCLQLPNLSSEMLAYHIFKEVRNKLKSNFEKKGIKKMSVEVIESAGQSASFEGKI